MLDVALIFLMYVFFFEFSVLFLYVYKYCLRYNWLNESMEVLPIDRR